MLFINKRKFPLEFLYVFLLCITHILFFYHFVAPWFIIMNVYLGDHTL